MKLIKKNILDLQSIPKNTQWLLLAAAFVLVLIMLTLVLTGHKSTTIIEDDTQPHLIMNPDSKSIDWTDTPVNETITETITIGANVPVKIVSVDLSPKIKGLNQPQETCSNIGNIDQKIKCTIKITYNPKLEQMSQNATLSINWHAENDSDTMQSTDTIEFIIGAKNTKPMLIHESQPEQKTDTKPVKESENIQSIESESESVQPTTVIKTNTVPSTPIANIEINDDDIIEDEILNDAIIETPISKKANPKENVKQNIVPRAESCSDFAFPGYDPTGKQIGWIRPDKGTYYFHPFSDKKCDTPTGKYNPDTGIIFDINNAGKKIGTDADHIGRSTIRTSGVLPKLSDTPNTKSGNRARQLSSDELQTGGGMSRFDPNATDEKNTGRSIKPGLNITLKQDTTIVGTSGTARFSSDPFDRTFVLRQYKPIPATIVSEVRADPSLYDGKTKSLPVRATVDRNVYSDNGRTIIIPTGTLLLGYVNGEIPGPYKSIGRMNISWYQFILPNGVEFNFDGDPETDPFSGDSQGRSGVPGHGSTDYVQQMVMPMLTAIIPAAVNMIAPISDKFVNQINLDNNTVVQSGTVRSSELAKNEIVTAWNKVAQKLMVDMLDNTVPPFSIAAGTRITVYTPEDLVITCGKDDSKKCSVNNVKATSKKESSTRATWSHQGKKVANDGSWTGQVASLDLEQFCMKNPKDENARTAKPYADIAGDIEKLGYSYNTIAMYCQASQYEAINNVKQKAVYQNQQSSSNQNSIAAIGGGEIGTKKYNENVLGLKYDENGAIENPFAKPATPESEPQAATITCEDGTVPDTNGCCTGEIYTDMGEQGFNCCPETGGDCFPPIPM